MQKFISVLIAAVLMVSALSGCANGTPRAENGKLSVVTTIFPEYDWAKNIIGDTDAADITMLLDSGVDLHSYQPTAADMVKISTCDLFIYVGGESDKWVEDALAGATNKDMVVINLLEALGGSVKEEELVEGMEGEEDDEGEEEEGPEYDEHVWLSLKNAAILVDTITDALAGLDKDHASAFTANASAYKEKLGELDTQFQAAVDAASLKTLLFGDRFPFRYLVDDYGLSYYAAFVGCSAETEASFETIAFLANKVQELNLGTVLTLEGTDHRIAETIISTSGVEAQILAMDSMQSVTAKDVANGADYLGIMEKNLTALTAALN